MPTYQMSVGAARKYIDTFYLYNKLHRKHGNKRVKKSQKISRYFERKQASGRVGIDNYIRISNFYKETFRKKTDQYSIFCYMIEELRKNIDMTGIETVILTDDEMSGFRAMYDDWELIYNHADLRKALGRLRGHDYDF
ncbi:hypothetical protein [Aureimonas altamirensis]|uniref:hypothetical protein n=1 Tax=Aureimonas altamirensis TaxID=370622 RepID=UPI00301A19A1